MSRNITRGGNFTRVTALADEDIILTWPASGDRAKGITKENLESQFEGDGSAIIIQTFSAGGTIADITQLVLSTGTHTLIMPANNNDIVEIKSISGVITLAPGSNTIENGNTVLTTTNRRLILNGTVWLEL